MSSDILKIFQEVGAVKEGHFLLTSGLHSPIYWEKFRILQYPHHTSRLCQLIAHNFIDQQIEIVVMLQVQVFIICRRLSCTIKPVKRGC